MAAARHKMPPEIASLSLDQIAERYIGRFRDKIPDWEAFEDAKIEGYRRGEHPFFRGRGPGEEGRPPGGPAPPRSVGVVPFPPRAGDPAAHPPAGAGVFFVPRSPPV